MEAKVKNIRFLRAESGSKNEKVKPPNALLTDINQNSNPFKNTVVLQRFFQLCDKTDLPRFRLVSKEWHNLSEKRFREEMQVKISIQKMDDRKRSMKKSKRLDWGKLDELQVGEALSRPFRSFRLFELSLGHTNNPCRFYNPNMNLFWGKFGQGIHQLELVGTQVLCKKAFAKAITEDTPNLQGLKIIDLKIHRKEIRNTRLIEEVASKVQLNLTSFSVEGDIPISWHNVFSSFPNIRKLGVNRLRSGYNDQVIIELVDTLEQRAFRKLMITDLNLGPTDVNDEGSTVVRFLRLPQVKLSSLCLLIEGHGSEDGPMGHAVTALQLHGHTLTTLRLFHYWRRRHRMNDVGVDLPFHLNTFSCLTELELEGSLCRNFHFLEAMPNLKVLKMVSSFRHILEETDMSKLANVTMVHLQEFHFKSVDITETAMEMFVKVMPNLERLYACFGKGSLRVAFQNWGNLRDLDIEEGYKWDKRIVCNNIGNEGITGIEDGCESRYPNITNLKYLHQLKLTRLKEITDVSVWEGFLKLPHLHTLTVDLSAWTTDEAFQALAERFPGGGVRRLPIPPSDRVNLQEAFFPTHHFRG